MIIVDDVTMTAGTAQKSNKAIKNGRIPKSKKGRKALWSLGPSWAKEVVIL
jgi:hypothetical protein